jgi:hypothetical protein
MIQSKGVKAVTAPFPEGYSCTLISVFVVCAYSETQNPKSDDY